VILDALNVIAEAVAGVEDRRMAIREARAVVEMISGEGAQAIEMRLDVRQHVLRQVDAQEIHERGIGAEEIEPRRIGSDRTRERR
jgi:hypothetical protein